MCAVSALPQPQGHLRESLYLTLGPPFCDENEDRSNDTNRLLIRTVHFWSRQERIPAETNVQNVISIWNGLELRRRIILVGATVAVFLAVLALARFSGGGQMVLLYAGLENRSAGEVVTALDQRGVIYEVRGDSIWVDAANRDSLRMSLAGEGLPAAGGAGYEILDNLSGFGTTSQMFDAAYWRAKEGELARTILAVPDIRAARVHISQGPSDPFRKASSPTASVTVTTASGRISDDQARALTHLVASAVSGMKASDVQVIDSAGGLVTPSEDGSPANAGDRSEYVRRSVERLLAARVGPGRAVVEVSMELQTEREQITERKFDPEGRVAVSTDSEEKSSQNSDPGGDVTVASNLPEGDAAAGATGQSQSSESRERVNYEISETQRELLRGPGGIRRMTVAVLVDGQMVTGDDGTQTWQPRPDSELDALRELVMAAAGIDEARGDQLTLKSMEFLPIAAEGTEATSGLIPTFGPLDTMSLIQIAALVIVALILGLFVLRPIIASGRNNALPAPASPLQLPGLDMSGGSDAVLNGEIDNSFELPDLPMIDFAGTDAPPEDPAERLQRLIRERQAESIEILRGWLGPDEERA
ncbi:flagellar M-ring protein FliF [Xinfangfangia sp. D13-10-4-6]|uniref:flagellar basal-body MS-ring/collar protein FliF n=1 Tax=Pseudogemmobacter hezensis TaxID=2737662 RepID=UPI00155522B1|nr:flagellar basal-body MS-ring/collar protein FliF [Pseudogemmobacter hezensis]NPD16634.1 flagellar M-ring protein FliF [Pseudogemmobacter hezensis]